MGGEMNYEELFSFVEGEVTVSRANQIEEHVSECNNCQERLSAIRTMIGDIGAVDEELLDIDLVGPVRIALAKQDMQQTKKRGLFHVPSFFAGLGSFAAAAAAAVLIIMPPAQQTDDSSEFRAKSAQLTKPDAFVGVTPYRMHEDQPVFLDQELGADEALVFSYSNRGEASAEHLMIFAVDAGNEVHWYYPAYTEEGTNPASIPIVPDAEKIELPEQVRHQLKPGPMAIYALFTHKPLHVSEVEGLIEGQTRSGRLNAATPNELPLKNVVQQIIKTNVR